MNSLVDIRKGDDFARPRRPNPDTLAYLKSLPLTVEVAQEEISNFNRQELQQQQQQGQTTRKKEDSTKFPVGSSSREASEFPSSLAAGLTALDEISQEVASLAGDERGSEALEVLIKITAPYSLRASHKWLSSCLGYVHHLALHRYGSHVLQTILEQCFLSTAFFTKGDGNEKDMALHPDSPLWQGQSQGTSEAMTTITKDDLWELLEKLHEELLPVASRLKTHLCASHVLRTLFLIMGGIECCNFGWRSPRRGKTKAKSHERNSSATSSGSNISGSRIQYLKSGQRRPANSTITTKVLDEWVDALAPPTTDNQLNELQKLVRHDSGSPLLMVLLQSLTYRDNATKVNRPSAEATDSSVRSLGKLPTEPKFEENSKACVLARRILCWQETGQSTHAEKVVYELSGDARGSRVVDTIFRLCHDEMHERIIEIGKFHDSLHEYVEHDVSNFVVQTLLATVRNAQVADSLIKASIPLVESGLILDVNNRRRGVLWRLTEMAVQYRVGQFTILQNLHLKCPRKQIAAMLLDPKLNSSDDNRLTLNVEGSRALFYLLHFGCAGAKEVLEGILAMSVQDLEALARDGLGSRCVWDVVLDEKGGVAVEDIVIKARTKLHTKLKGRWASLATDRVGHHTVRKLFLTLPTMKAREELVQELGLSRHRLYGNAMGRSILSECEVDLYKNQGFVAWSKRIQKRMEQREWLGELSSNAIDNGSECANDISPKVAKANQGSFHHPKCDCDPEQRLSKKLSTANNMTMDSIFDAMTLPKKSDRQKRKRLNEDN